MAEILDWSGPLVLSELYGLDIQEFPTQNETHKILKRPQQNINKIKLDQAARSEFRE